MEDTDHRRGVEQSIDKGKAIHVRRNIDVSIRLAKPLLRLFQLCARVIEQDDAIEAGIARRISPGARAKLEQEASLLWEEALESNGFGAVFVLTPAFIPEGPLVI
jgi:hypothetical protein